MVIRHSKLLLLPLAISALLISPAKAGTDGSEAAGSEKLKPSIEEMRGHRRQMRDDLMIPSLKGIRGLAFGVPGHCPKDAELEEAIEGRLKQLPIIVKKYQSLENGVTKPIDAFLQIKCLGAGERFAVVELTVTQWCSLSRDPNITARTITYTDQAVSSHSMLKHTAMSMVDQFIIDFQKANSVSNQSLSSPSASSSNEDSDKQASDDGHKKKKKSKKS